MENVLTEELKAFLAKNDCKITEFIASKMGCYYIQSTEKALSLFHEAHKQKIKIWANYKQVDLNTIATICE